MQRGAPLIIPLVHIRAFSQQEVHDLRGGLRRIRHGAGAARLVQRRAAIARDVGLSARIEQRSHTLHMPARYRHLGWWDNGSESQLAAVKKG